MAFQEGIFRIICIYSLLFSSNIEKHQVSANFGGNDLFTSLAQLEVLWQDDVKVVNQMENMVKKMERAITALKL